MDEAPALILQAHRRALQALSVSAGVPFSGLAAAARKTTLSRVMAKRLIRLDVAAALTRHITRPDVESLFSSVVDELGRSTAGTTRRSASGGRERLDEDSEDSSGGVESFDGTTIEPASCAQSNSGSEIAVRIVAQSSDLAASEPCSSGAAANADRDFCIGEILVDAEVQTRVSLGAHPQPEVSPDFFGNGPCAGGLGGSDSHSAVACARSLDVVPYYVPEDVVATNMCAAHCVTSTAMRRYYRVLMRRLRCEVSIWDAEDEDERGRVRRRW